MCSALWCTLFSIWFAAYIVVISLFSVIDTAWIIAIAGSLQWQNIEHQRMLVFQQHFSVLAVTHFNLLSISIKWTVCPCSSLRVTPCCAVFQTNCLESLFMLPLETLWQECSFHFTIYTLAFPFLKLRCHFYVGRFQIWYLLYEVLLYLPLNEW